MINIPNYSYKGEIKHYTNIVNYDLVVVKIVVGDFFLKENIL